MPLISPAARMAAVYGATFVTFGIHMPFFPVFLAERGLVETEIAAILAVPMLLRAFTSPILGMIADRAEERAVVLTLYAVVAAAGFMGFFWAKSFWAMLAITALAALTWNGILPVAETIAMAVVRRGLGEYGRMRVWGSIGFIGGTLAAGVVLSRTSPEIVLPLLVGCFWLQALVTLAAPRFGRAAAAPAEPSAAALRFRDLAADRGLMIVLAGVALIQASHAMSYGFSSLHWTAQGYDEAAVAVFWAVAVLCEIAMFTLAAHVTARFAPLVLIVAGGAVAVLRWAAFATVSSGLVWVLVQASHALTFAAVHLGTILFLARAAPERLSGSLQGLVVTVTGIAMAAATFASGPLYKSFGAGGFLCMSLLAAAGAALVATRFRSARTDVAGIGGKTGEPT